MNEYFADFHIHIGRSYLGRAVKITASNQLTFSNIIEEASERKGLDLIGIIDMHSPEVLEEVDLLIREGVVQELTEGGLRYKQTTVIMGCEVEVRFEAFGCSAHFLVYCPTLTEMKAFSAWLATKVTNPHLSTQRLYASMEELQEQVQLRQAVLIPAHIFTPFKSVYGNCSDSIQKLLDLSQVPAVELGLSSDTEMADRLSELTDQSFVTNSDAHSLAKIGREYQKMRMKACNFKEWKMALWRQEGRQIVANYGLQPKLGKYHLTRCAACSELVSETAGERCPDCGHPQLIQGVFNRLQVIADRPAPLHPAHRPPYIHQVPLEFIPKLGPKTMERLLGQFQTEMNVLHEATEQQLADVVGAALAAAIIKNRQGQMRIASGGGGRYGKVLE
ncbi:hypothetical protein BEP19_01415 [Ammoniphilus oxalaticus]|uniref:TIGR00375 family protein n=1 Tax=Ammoniphilus oxalaticus TaxID=66863 RepID=A0A419SMU7_9BACL|nr:endonuclease Q family protein [Ammoniphilus oxalaticus]RKD25630.1 hypothetical protein BEP19_01415 [Ammoniphilus oxalaticus]